ncbi:NAD(P)H dehydrogenase [Actinidia chinensis var. chinensis]|uniref:NAD(P)H dehydrogenase n=1 Tax=Actinidia chinensis var. chinensis TaxID=1590841 RepID=A0A2R6PAV2_ACTCC|nr:NAD(P)H dehydrogenase [Actinidia chinensis var. chinensis]
MHRLISFSFKNPQILASMSNNSPSPSHHTNPKPPMHRIQTSPEANHSQQKRKQQKQKQPSIAEIERVIGAGAFKDRDTTNRDSEQNKSVFDAILSNSVGKTEGSVERKLRETGEWIIDRTERKSNSAGKNILVAVFQWVLPLWILSFLVASGVVKLPFSAPFLDDLIM